jgi:DNA-binding CsgD family transcriptional regulator
MSIVPPNHRSSATPLTPKFARLRSDLERAECDVESGAKTAPANVLDLQRRAIAALRECADSAVELAEHLGETSCPRDVTCLHLGDWNRCNSCFNEQAGRFFDQASKFLNAVVASAEPAPYAMAKRGFAESRSCDTFPTRTASFTEAQQRVFELLVTGLPNKLIAYEIGVSEATVKAHVSAVLRKLRVRSRAQAIALSSAFERRRNDYSPAAV